jgi:hypothetical protein
VNRHRGIFNSYFDSLANIQHKDIYIEYKTIGEIKKKVYDNITYWDYGSYPFFSMVFELSDRWAKSEVYMNSTEYVVAEYEE